MPRPLLAHVEEYAPTLLFDGLEGEAHLLAAVAAGAGEHVSGETLAVDTYQDGVVAGDIALDQGHVLVLADRAVIGDSLELSVGGWETGLGDALDELVVTHAKRYEVGDGDYLEGVLIGKLGEVRKPGHGAVFVHDFADDAGGVETGEFSEINDGLGLAGADQDAAITSAEGEHVSRSGEVFGPSVGVYKGGDSAGPVKGGDAGGDLASALDRDSECGAEGCGVVLNHHGDSEVFEAFPGHGNADETAPVLGHEINDFRAALVGGDGEIALVLTVLVIDNDDHLPGLEILNGLGDGGEWHPVSSGLQNCYD